MRIELASLEGPKGEFAHAYAPDELDLADEWVRLRVAPEVSGHLRREGSRVKVAGKLDAQLELECDRCLKRIEFPVATRFKLEYVTREDYQGQLAARATSEPTIELAAEDLDLAVFDGDVIDLDELVREELLLAVPTHLLCQDDCKGTCSICGGDRNAIDCRCEVKEVDARWAGLNNLRF
jgi:uncharacterized protein